MDGHESCFTHTDHVLGAFGLRELTARGLGRFIDRHVHTYGHLEEILRGRVQVILELPTGPAVRNLDPGAAIYIPAGVHHTAIALTPDACVRCLFHAPTVSEAWEISPASAVNMARDPAFV